MKDLTYKYMIGRSWCSEWNDKRFLNDVFDGDKNLTITPVVLLQNELVKKDEKLTTLLHSDFMPIETINDICKQVMDYSALNSKQFDHITEDEVIKMNQILKSKSKSKYIHILYTAECLSDGSMDCAFKLLEEYFNVNN